MADNGQQSLDPDIAECMRDILRIRQSIVNSRSGQMAPDPEIVIPAASLAAAPAENPVSASTPVVEAVAIEDEAPLASIPSPEPVVQVAPTATIPITFSQSPPSADVPAAENPFAVTKEEVAALFDDQNEPAEVPAPSEMPVDVEAPIAASQVSFAQIGETPEAVAIPEEIVPPVMPVDSELETIVKEAEDWMQQVSPEEPQPDLAGIDEPQTSAEAPVRPERHFDQVVSNLQGEQLIAPVDDEPPTAPDEDDIKLKVIQGLKEEPLDSDEERSGVPRFDLEESSLGGTLESRRNVAATRKGPGRKTAAEPELAPTEVVSVQQVQPPASPEPVIEEKSTEPIAQAHADEAHEPEAEETSLIQAFQRRPEFVTQALALVDNRSRLERQTRILAQIVARDIELLCGQSRRQRARVVWR